MVLTGHLLKAAGYEEELIAMENIIPWEDLKSFKGMSRGPDKSLLLYKLSWVNCVRILLELVFRKLDLDTENYTQEENVNERAGMDLDKYDFVMSDDEESREVRPVQQQTERLLFLCTRCGLFLDSLNILKEHINNCYDFGNFVA